LVETNSTIFTIYYRINETLRGLLDEEKKKNKDLALRFEKVGISLMFLRGNSKQLTYLHTIMMSHSLLPSLRKAKQFWRLKL